MKKQTINKTSLLRLLPKKNVTAFTLFVFSLASCGGGGSNETENSQIPETQIPEAEAPETEVPETETPGIVIEHEPAVLEVSQECDANAPIGLSSDIQDAIILAESRYTDLLERTNSSNQKYIDYTDANGTWELVNPSRWTSGFLPGVHWYLYGLTDTASWRTIAEASTAGLRELASATDNDTGFQIYGSYGIGRNILEGIWDEADDAIDEAANTLMQQRDNPNIGAFRAWPQSEGNPLLINSSRPFEVNVDMIMNMEVVLSAAEKSGDLTFVNAAISHADIAWEYIVRADFSSYQVAAFNADGSLNYHRTQQGWLEDSTWSRGQSWSVYGNIMLYRYTNLPRMLERSEQAYQYFKQTTLARNGSWIPYADFDASISIRNPLDTSAAAVVASAALELYETTGNTLYLQDANDILNELVRDYLSEGTDFDSLLLAGSEQYVREDDDLIPNPEGYEVGASFGDFYFLEALYRLKNAEAPECN